MMIKKKKKKPEPEKQKESSNKSTPSPLSEQKQIKFQNNNNIIGGFDIQYIRKFYSDKDFIRKNAGLLPCENIEN